MSSVADTIGHVRVALVSPYSYTYPGGVGRHVDALAHELTGLGHEIRLLAPYDPDDRLARVSHRGASPQRRPLPDYVVPLGRTAGLPMNGAVSNLAVFPKTVGVLGKELRQGGSRPNGMVNVLFVGRAEERKGLPVLLRSFEALRGAGVDARLTVAGPAPEEVESMLLDAEGIHLAGQVEDDEKWRLLGEADLLCAPSLGGESFGMVLTEAFASGTPVVASDIAGYRDVVRSRQDGLLVPVGDAVALGEVLRDLAGDRE